MTPGSFAAKQLGCTCPEFENNYGTSMGFAVCDEVARYVVAHSCLIHGAVKWGLPYQTPPDLLMVPGKLNSSAGEYVKVVVGRR